ncbi:MAG: hypothetical protein DCF16_06075 [Alphaproteobacteria bacterium]|nr:MAG: hypothetical protein DCF16_06075 [Alphaproteobacteria bacterium]
MKHAIALAAIVLVTACASPAPNAPHSPVERGQAMAAQNCSGCHAIGRSGDSPAPQAPPFRTLSQNYPLEALEEAFAEGISVGHAAMPEFAFAPDDVNALVAYLQSIQDPPTRE